MNVKLKLQENRALIVILRVRQILHNRMKEAQSKDPQLFEKIEKVKQGEDKNFKIQNDILMMGSRICIPDVDNLHREILEGIYIAPYAKHSRMIKMYNTL